MVIFDFPMLATVEACWCVAVVAAVVVGGSSSGAHASVEQGRTQKPDRF